MIAIACNAPRKVFTSFNSPLKLNQKTCGVHQPRSLGCVSYLEHHLYLRPKHSTRRGIKYVSRPQVKASSAGFETCVADKFNDFFKSINKIIDGRNKGILLMNCLCIVFGSNAALLKIEGSQIDPCLYSAIRFSIAAAALSPIMLRSAKIRGLSRPLLAAGLELGLEASFGYLTQAVALTQTESSRVSFIGAFTVIFVPFLAACNGSHLPKINWISAAIALFGMCLMETGGINHISTGDLLAFASAFAFGLQLYRTEQKAHTLRNDEYLSLVSLELLVIAISCVVFFGGNLLMHSTSHVGPQHHLYTEIGHFFRSPLATASIVYTGLVSTALCLWIEVAALQDVSATEAALIYSTEPVWGYAFAWLLLGERLSGLGYSGAFLIVLSSLVTQLWGRTPAPDEEKLISNQEPGDSKIDAI